MRGNSVKNKWLLWCGVGLVGLAALVVWRMLDSSSDTSPLTDRENLLFSVVMLILSTLGGVLITIYFAQAEARSQNQQLARPAWRRVVQLAKSADQISDAIQEKIKKVDQDTTVDSKIALEWMDMFQRLVAQHRGQLDDAISDWHEVLPHEFAQIADIAKLRSELSDQIAERDAAIARNATENSQQVASLESKISQLEKTIKTKQYELVSSTGTNPTGMTIGTYAVGSNIPLFSQSFGHTHGTAAAHNHGALTFSVDPSRPLQIRAATERADSTKPAASPSPPQKAKPSGDPADPFDGS